MADRYPYRPGTPDSQNPSAAAGSDPLAELARLIGQTDPFAGLGRSEPNAAPSSYEHEPQPFSDPHDAPAPELENPGRPAWLRNLPPLQHEPEPPSNYPAPPETAHQPQPAGWPPLAAGPSRYDDVLFGHNAQQHDAQGGYPQDAYAPQEGYPTAQFPAAHYPSGQYGHDQYAQGQADHYDPQYDQYAPDAYPYRAEEDEPAAAAPRRGGMVTVAVVLALALVGTAGAFAFRSFRGPSSGEPPIIRADSSPTKITPAASADASNKISDRVSGGGSERIVPREEQPVDVKDPSKARVVFPPLNQGGATAGTASAGSATVPPVVGGGTRAAAAAPAPQDDEPRRVKTLNIRGDGSMAAAPAPVTSAPPVAPVVPTATAKRTSVTAPPPVPAPAAPAPARQPVTQAAPLASPPSSGANGPLQLTPPGATSSQAADTRTRVASVQPTQTAPRTDSGGAFFVQVSSQRNEADAQNSYRALQSKFPSVLASRQPIIKRADLGDKGVFYRAMVGPFATQAEAGQFCGNLTNAGGQCVVPRN